MLADLLDYPEVSRLLGLEPTHVFLRGQHVTPSVGGPVRRWDRWEFAISDPAGPEGEPSQDAGVSLRALLAALSPSAEVMARYSKTHQVSVSLILWIQSDTLRLPLMILPPALSALAARLGSGAGFSIYTNCRGVSWK
jgi:hypothetical protein